MTSNQGLPASLKTRDTPIGRAALARRRKRASAVAGDASRFVSTPTNEAESDAEEEAELRSAVGGEARTLAVGAALESKDNSQTINKFNFSERDRGALLPPKYGSTTTTSTTSSATGIGGSGKTGNGYSHTDSSGNSNSISRMGTVVAVDQYKRATHQPHDISNANRMPPPTYSQEDDNDRRNKSRNNSAARKPNQQLEQNSAQLSSKELLEKSTLVAETAANVLESARKSSSARKQQQQRLISSPQNSIDGSEASITPSVKQSLQFASTMKTPMTKQQAVNTGMTTDCNDDTDTHDLVTTISSAARSLTRHNQSSSQRDTHIAYNGDAHNKNTITSNNTNDVARNLSDLSTSASAELSLVKTTSSSSSQRMNNEIVHAASNGTSSGSHSGNYGEHDQQEDHVQYHHRRQPRHHESHLKQNNGHDDDDTFDDTDDEDNNEQGYSKNNQYNRPSASNDVDAKRPPETVEELEPLLNPATELLDASCLRNGSWIMIRSKARSETVAVNVLQPSTTTSSVMNGTYHTSNRSNYNQLPYADIIGFGIGKAEECFQIIKLGDNRNPNEGSATTIHENESYNKSMSVDNVLRYGDTIALRSQLYDEQLLGVRKVDVKGVGSSISNSSSSSRSSGIYELGLFQNSPVLGHDDLHDPSTAVATIAPADKWTVLRGGTNHPVRIGPSAVAAASTNKTTSMTTTYSSTSNSGNTSLVTTAAIRSGEQILLRNVLNGGYLSVSAQDGRLEIITDSYKVNPTHSKSTSLLNQLQFHDNLLPTKYQTFIFLTSSVPPLPRWVFSNDEEQRIYRNQSYLVRQQQVAQELEPNFQEQRQRQQDQNQQQKQLLSQVDILSTSTGQERLLLDQVIGALLGLEGSHIRTRSIPKSNDENDMDNNCVSETLIEFLLIGQEERGLDISLCQLIERILPLATSYIRLTTFISNHFPGYEYGSVMHAFCETIDCMLQDYIEFVTQLEIPYRQLQNQDENKNKVKRLTMQQLYVHIQPLLHSMSILYRSTIAVRDKIGGALINTLSELKNWVCEGDTVATNILQILIEKTSLPYMKMLTIWLRQGELRDPYNEFMIEFSCERNEFIVRDEHILQGLKNSNVLTKRIVATGKYWQAVRICEKIISPSSSSSPPRIGGKNNDIDCSISDKQQQQQQYDEVQLLRYSLDFASSGKSSYIQSMYNQASKALIRLLINDFQLMASLRVMKRYFLLDQGDFVAHFLDSAQEELLKDSSDISLGRMQHLLRMSIQITEGVSLDQDSYYANDEEETDHDGNTKRRRCPLSPLALRCHFVQGSLIDQLDTLQNSDDNTLRSSNASAATVSEQILTPRGSGSVGGSFYERTPYSASSFSSRSHYHHNEYHNTSTSKNKASKNSKQLTGVEAFVVEFPQIPFPLSMVLNDRALGNYQLLFRLLFFAKHVERRLLGIWRDHQVMKELSYLLRGSFGQTFLLRQRMLHFSQNLIYYIMFEVIEPNWLEMERAIDIPCHSGQNGDNSDEKKNSQYPHQRQQRWQQQQQKQQTVDDIVDIHDEFLGRTLEACLLTNRDLVKTLTKLIKTCIMFSDQMKLFMEATKIYDDNYNIAMERQKAIQRSLNNRLAGVGDNGGLLLSKSSSSAASLSSSSSSNKSNKKNALREAMNTFKQERQARVQKQMHRVGRELSSESYRRMVSRFDEVFSAYLAEFMIQLNNSDATGAGSGSTDLYHSFKTNLCIRLDYNSYLSSSVGGLNNYS